MLYPKLLQLDVTGLPDRWVTWQEAACAYALDRVCYELGDRHITLRGGMRDGVRSTLDVSTIYATRDRSRRRWDAVPYSRRAVQARDFMTCMYCGEVFPERALTIDHIVPRAMMGPSTFMNTCAACLDCNSKKGCRTPEMAGMVLLAAPYVPSHFEALILSNRHILGDQMSYLRQGLPANSRLLQ